MIVILFDIDGTLVNTAGAGGAALCAALRQEFGVQEPEQVPFSGRTDRGIVGKLFDAHQIEHTDRNWQRLRERYLAGLPHVLPQRPGRVLPGIPQLLEQLRQRSDVTLGLLTGNMADAAQLKLQHFGLHHHFRFGAFGDHHAHRDDVAREAWQTTCRVVGPVQPQQVWIVGDTPLDVACARAIGVRVAAVATGVHPRNELEPLDPDLMVDDFHDPQPLLDALRQ